ncbi:dynamin family protein [Rhexocercosporidium sp. MPI-PUGE-AT-0058]|nr:dynamin family protein [Rhexocercosporidium sp. MPI-PUGE-AT-0058]
MSVPLVDLRPQPQDGAFPSLGGLRSAKSIHRLKQIARVKAKGVGDHVALPQLVVCGDQSAGKSSVLEGITGIPFPRQDGVCTKFATEIILSHNTEIRRIVATIIPHKSRSTAERQQLQHYHRILADFSELPGVIEDASLLMKLRGCGTDDGLTFAEDVLRIEVVGDTGLNLTIVDLPGLIAVASDEQTDENVQLVARLVDSYLESSRTIILAVVQANNDIANQGIIQRARRIEKAGVRTVGTKKRIALLTKNLDTTKLKLGYFSRLSESRRKLTSSQQLLGVNIDSIRPVSVSMRLESSYRIYSISILRESSQKSVKRFKLSLASTEAELASLGDEHPMLAHMRMYLTRCSMEYCNLAQAALDGNYHDRERSFFDGSEGYTMRLRAEIHKLNGAFAAYVCEKGSKRKVVNNDQSEGESDSEDEHESADGQLQISQKEFDLWVKETYVQTRGRKLPSNYNHFLPADLFHEHPSRWPDIANQHIAKVFRIISNFVERALMGVILEDDMRQEILFIATSKLEEARKLGHDELQKLLTDEKRQPITYNHYYTDNIQNAREDSLKGEIRKAIWGAAEDDFKGKLHVSNTSMDADRLLPSLEKSVGGLKAYCKVAMKTFVDNVCRQVIERHLLANLPEIFG